MKVLHVLYDLQLAGAQSFVVNILKNINRELFDIRLCVLYASYNNNLARELIEKRIPVYFLDKHKGLDLKMFCRINWILTNFKPDIIHTHNYIMRYTIIPTLLNQIPVRVHTLHTPAQREVGLIGKSIHWIAYNFFNVIPVSVADNVAESVKKVYGITSYVIHNGIPVNRFKTIGKSQTKKKTETIFINISGFRPAKNHRLLINAFTGVAKVKNNTKLLLVGDGPLRSGIEELVKERNLRDRILFLGERDDIPELLDKSDVYVSSSEWEGFGLSIVEAMAAGKPTIATAVDGVLELVEDGITGILVPPHNTNKFTSAMIMLANCPDLRKKMGEKGRKQAIKRFNINNIVRNYENFYINLYKRYITKLKFNSIVNKSSGFTYRNDKGK